MTTSVQAAIALIKSAITGQVPVMPAEYSMKHAQRLLKEQGLLPIGFVAATKCGYDQDEKLMKFLTDYYCMAVVQSEQQMQQIQAICDAFEEAGIDYMPVKGAIMKTMYPSHELRSMSDADILIRQEQYSQIQPIMERLGFTGVGESDHEYIWDSAYLRVELHKRLMPTYHKDYYCYFGEGWDLAKTQNGYRWSMTEEDAYIYNFIHFAKHYRDGEGNCRFVIDLWVHQKCRPDMDMTYIRRRLAEMKMETFYNHILSVMQAWFEDGPTNEVIEWITQVLFNIDKQEKEEVQAAAKSVHHISNHGSEKKAKRNRLLSKIFPDRDHMNWSYPQWKKLPLAIAWILRWICLLFVRPETLKKNSKTPVITSQRSDSYREELAYVGLEFSDGVALPD